MKLANSDIDAARMFHEVTKHSYTSVRTTPHFLDWDNRPFLYKIYPSAGSVAMPRDLNLPAVPTLSALRGEIAKSEGQTDLSVLTRLLFCAGGLTRRKRVGAEDYHFRAAPSAGALYPVEIYVAAAETEELEAGLYHFSPADLKLRGLRRGDWRYFIAQAAAMRPEVVIEAQIVLVMTAIFWRSAWKYRARAYRYCFWDTGTVLANLLAAASAEGISAEVVTAFMDHPLETLLDVDGDREGVTCVVALGKSARAQASPAELPGMELDTVPLSAEEVVYDDLVKIHQASHLASAEEVRAVGQARLQLPAHISEKAVAPEIIEPGSEFGLGETIIRRGSTRIFATEPIEGDELATIMANSSGHPAVDFPRMTETYLIVNAVEGLEPGAYYYRRETAAFELIRSGDFRKEAGYLCLEQPLGADCSALICYMADLEAVLRVFGNRGYRDAHLEAGILGGRAYLAAYAIGCGATGLTFYDDDTSKFFEPHAMGLSPLLMVAIGVPRPPRASEAD